MRGLGHDLRRLVHLEQPEVRRTRHVEQHPARSSTLASSIGLEIAARAALTAAVARRVPDAHERAPGVAHDHAHVGEVGVDEPRGRDEVGDALHTLEQHLVAGLERVEHRGALVGHGEQAVVRDDDERVDLLAHLLDAVLGLHAAPASLEAERPRGDADGERADGLGDLGHDRATAGAGAATLAEGDEHHVGALQHLFDLVAVVLGGLAADLGIGPRAEPA